MADKVLTGKQKAAAVVVALGADSAAKIYRHLKDEEIEQLTLEVATLPKLNSEEMEQVLGDFYEMCLAQKFIMEGGVDYAKDILEKAFGIQNARNVIDKVIVSIGSKAFDFMRKTEPKQLYNFIQSEHPQTIALILAHATKVQATSVLGMLPKEKLVQVIERIAKMDRTSPETIRAVESVLEKQFTSILPADFAEIGGVDYIADVINSMDRSNEKFIFDELSKRDVKLADDIHNKMFVFEDIILLDNRAIQRFLNDVDQQDLVYALKGANQEAANVIFTNMSSRKVEMVKSDLEVTFNVRMRDVEEAQQRIVSVIRRLEEEGELVIAKGGKDEIIA